MLTYSRLLIIICTILSNFCFIKVSNAGLFDYTIHYTAITNDFNEARKNAIQDNRKESLSRVMEKFIAYKNFNTVYKLLDDDTAYFFEDKMRISNENIANNLYNVDITYYFNQEKIFDFLTNNNIPYVTLLNNKVLLIPLYNNALPLEASNNTENNSDLASITTNNLPIVKTISINEVNLSANPAGWYNLWRNLNPTDYLSNIVLPEDVSKIDISKINTNDINYLSELKKQYGVDDVVVAYLDLVQKAPTPAENTSGTEDDESLSANTENSKDTEAQAPVSTDNSNAIAELEKLSIAPRYNLKIFRLKSNESQDFLDIKSMNNAFSLTLGIAEDDSKVAAIANIEDKNVAVFKVEFTNFVDWVTIYNTLQHINQIERVNLTEIDKSSVIIKIKFYGALGDIIKAASQKNVVIDPANLLIKCNAYCY